MKTGRKITSSPSSSKPKQTYLRTSFLRPIRPATSKPPPRSTIEPGSGADEVTVGAKSYSTMTAAEEVATEPEVTVEDSLTLNPDSAKAAQSTLKAATSVVPGALTTPLYTPQLFVSEVLAAPKIVQEVGDVTKSAPGVKVTTTVLSVAPNWKSDSYQISTPVRVSPRGTSKPGQAAELVPAPLVKLVGNGEQVEFTFEPKTLGAPMTQQATAPSKILFNSLSSNLSFQNRSCHIWSTHNWTTRIACNWHLCSIRATSECVKG